MVWLLVVMVATLVTFILPESFSSRTRIKIERDRTDISGFVESAPANTYDPYFIQTEVELIQSEVILGKVVAELNLDTVWGKKYGVERLKSTEVIPMLKNQMSVNPQRNTSLIEIRFFSERPDEAAKIANCIADVYRRHRHDQRKEPIQGGIKALEERFQAQEEKVRVAQTNVDRLREDLEREVGTAITNDSARAAHSRPYLEAKRNLEELERFRQSLDIKIANEQVDLALPATSMVQIVDTAKPGLMPVRPNKPLNIFVGIIVGGMGGLFLATLVFVLQHRYFRRMSGIPRTQLPPRFRAVVHILIALVVGVIVGYLLANPLDSGTIIGVPLTLLLGAIGSGYIELANARPASESAPRPIEPKYATLKQ
jgi:uncharacterized protein involved in exopolysaccharide biosynthesis